MVAHPDIPPEELSAYLTFAVETAEAAGKKTLEYFRTSIEVERKSDSSPVTIADRETEALVRARVQSAYPDHTIVGEEQGTTGSSSRYSWVIDPIDGTKSFIRGVPLYTVLLAFLVNDEPIVGVIHCPPLGETVAAAVGLGCTYNGRPCSVSNTTELESALVLATDFGDLCRAYPHFSSQLCERAAMTRTWADGYGYLLVATGRADAMLDPIMNLWDIAPLAPVITEAGGTFTDIKGAQSSVGTSALAAPNHLHQHILDLHE